MPKGHEGCGGCPLELGGQGFCKPDGDGSYGVMLVGEALGEEEVAAGGTPFVGKAGQFLNRMIERTNDPISGAPLQRSKFKVANVYSCRPPDNSLEFPGADEAMDHCAPNLDKAIKEAQPKVILALGKVALYRLTGLGRERKRGIEYWRGSVLESPYGWVIPTFHPSYLMRGNYHLAFVFISDLLRALRIARKGVPKRSLDYICYPNLAKFQEFVAEWRKMGRPPLAFDIETPYRAEDEDEEEDLALEDQASWQILRIGFSFKENHAITMAWQEPFKSLAIEILSEAPELTVWNEDYDCPRLVAAGVNFSGAIYDAMKMFHRIYPALRYNLQFAMSILWGDDYKAWKHTSNSEPEHYNCHDNATLLRGFNFCKEKLVAEGGLELFVRHFVKNGVLLRKMKKHGIAVNHARRKAARVQFQSKFDSIVQELQPLIPLELKPKQVFKLSKEALEKKFGPLEAPQWIAVEESLTEKELEKLRAKEAKAAEKLRLAEEKRLQKELTQIAKAAARKGPKRIRSSASRKVKKDESESEDLSARSA